MVDEKAVAKKSDAMDGLIKEGEVIMEETGQGPVRDPGIIAASQKWNITKSQLMEHSLHAQKHLLRMKLQNY